MGLSGRQFLVRVCLYFTRYHDKEVTLRLLLLIAIVLASRLPFLSAGYGSDPDAWRIAGAARVLGTTGEYVASRLPGYPVPEILYSLIWKGGPIALNLVTALLSASSVALFFLSLRLLSCHNSFSLSLGLAFTPIIYVNSTNAMDYVWALTFILGGFYLVIHDQPWFE